MEGRDSPVAIEHVNHSEANMLIYALRLAQVEIATLFVEGGFDVNKVSSVDGSTPLVTALMRNYPPLCALLLQHGADPNVPRRT